MTQDSLEASETTALMNQQQGTFTIIGSHSDYPDENDDKINRDNIVVCTAGRTNDGQKQIMEKSDRHNSNVFSLLQTRRVLGRDKEKDGRMVIKYHKLVDEDERRRGSRGGGGKKEEALQNSFSGLCIRDKDENENKCLVKLDGCAKGNTQERDTAENTNSTMWKRFTLLMCISATILTSSSCSLFLIFFPQEATRKGISLTVVGAVFSVFQFSITLVSPFAGKYGSKVGIKFMCLAAIFLEGSSTALYGILDKGPGGAIFAVECIAIRIVEAIGCACFYVAAQSILSHQYSDIGFVFSVIDSTMNVGFMIGPSVGGFLYELGGFGLPFYVIGSGMLVNGLVLYLFLPDIRDPEEEKEEEEKGLAEQSSSSSFYRLLRHSLVLVSWTSIALTTAGVSMYQTLYTARLATFDMKASVLGGLFTIGPLTFIVSAMLFGYLSRFESLRGIFMTAGQFLLGLSFLVNAPRILFPFIPIDDIWTASLSFVTMSFCAGILQIVGTSCIFTGAWEMGYEKNLETYAIVSGLYNTAYCGGCAVGPFVGGAAVDHFGFTKVFTVYGLTSVCFTSLMLGYFLFRCKRENETRKTTKAKGYGSIEGGVEM